MRGSHGVLPLVVLLLIIPLAAGEHFHYGTLSWERVSGHTVRFTLVSAWSTDYQPYIEQAQAQGAVNPPYIAVGQAIQLQGTENPVLQFGDGVGSFAIVKARVVAVDAVLQIWRGEFVWEHTYPSEPPSTGSWTATFSGCCRPFAVTTPVDATSMYSPKIAVLPRQVLIAQSNSSFFVAAYDGGTHPAQEGSTGRFMWEIVNAGSMLAIDAATGRVNTTNSTEFEALKVRVVDQTSGVFAEVEMEVHQLPVTTDAVPALDMVYPAAMLPLPAINELVTSFSAIFTLRFMVPGTPPDATALVLEHSALPPGATLDTTLASVDYNMMTGFETTFQWTPAEEQQGWTAMCVQVHHVNASSAVSSQAYCFDIAVVADSPPALEAILPPELAGFPAGTPAEWHMGQRLNISLVATDRMANVIDIVPVGQLPAGAELSELQMEQGSAAKTATRVLSWEPDPKAGGSSGRMCFTAGDGGVSSQATCVEYRVPKCMYKVREEEALVDIAGRFGTSWLQLWALNKKQISRPEGHGLEGTIHAGFDLHVGQLVLVKEGDSLERIAARFGTTLRQIVNLNAEMTPTRQLLTGQLVCLVPSSCTERA